jgi:hypothetical protein
MFFGDIKKVKPEILKKVSADKTYITFSDHSFGWLLEKGNRKKNNAVKKQKAGIPPPLISKYD